MVNLIVARLQKTRSRELMALFEFIKKFVNKTKKHFNVYLFVAP